MVLRVRKLEDLKRRKPKAPLEKEITAAIREYLKARRVFCWKVWQGLGSARGIPDILGILPNGRMLAIEVKTAKGKLRPEQEDFLNAAKALGAKAFVARSVDDVMAHGL